jgi:hypothetical protein
MVLTHGLGCYLIKEVLLKELFLSPAEFKKAWQEIRLRGLDRNLVERNRKYLERLIAAGSEKAARWRLLVDPKDRHYQAAKRAYENKDYQTALEECQRCLDSAPDHLWAHVLKTKLVREHFSK